MNRILSLLGLVRKKDTLEYLFEQYHEWAEKQFPNSTYKSSIEGLKREVLELESELFDNTRKFDKFATKTSIGLEYVDCIMYLMDSSRRYGITQSELFINFKEKLEINKKRNWKINEDKSYSHIK